MLGHVFSYVLIDSFRFQEDLRPSRLGVGAACSTDLRPVGTESYPFKMLQKGKVHSAV